MTTDRYQAVVRLLLPLVPVVSWLAAGMALLLAGAWIVSRIGRQYGTDPELDWTLYVQAERLKARRIGQRANESLQAKAARRRDYALAKRREAAAIASGQPADERIKLVGRR